MRLGMTGKVASIVMLIVFLSVGILVGINYQSSQKQVIHAAGVELVGCANITTGIINAEMLAQLANGDQTVLTDIENAISWTVSKKDIFEAHYVLSLDGKVLAADNSLKAQGFQAGDDFYIDQNAMDMVLDMQHGQYTEIYDFGGMERITGYAPIFEDHDPSKKIIAINAIDFDAQIIKDRTWDMVQIPLIIGVFLPLFAALITVLVIRKMIKPISEISNHVNKVANGKLNLEPLNIKNKDELGQLSENINSMTDSLKNMIENVTESSGQLAATSQQLTASTGETTRAATNIASSIQHVAEDAEQQMNHIVTASKEMTVISKKMEDVGASIGSATSASHEAATTAGFGNEQVGQVMEQMKVIGSNTNLLSQTIYTLDERAKEITLILSLITDVSKQTNLLALNAAIEAARAGEHGKGFAIVAGEVQKLAEQTSKATAQINTLVHEIQEEVKESVITIDQGSAAVQDGISMVTDTSISFGKILEKTTAASEELNSTTHDVVEIRKQIQSMVEMMNKIAKITTSTSKNTEEIAASSEEQMAMMNELSHASNELAHVAEELQRLIEVFE